MDLSAKNPKMGTPTKCLKGVRSNVSEGIRNSENSNPNVTSPAPNQKPKIADLGTPTKCPQGVRSNAPEGLRSSENSNPNVTSPAPNQKPKIANLGTPTKCLQGVRSNAPEGLRSSENSNPNVTSPAPTQKTSASPLLLKSSGKLQKSAPRNSNVVLESPRIRIKERKFVVPKKKKKKDNNEVKDAAANPNCKCKDKVNGKCLCLAYETLRASQEEFLKTEPGFENPEMGNGRAKDGSEIDCLGVNEAVNCEPLETESPNGNLGSSGKRRRDKLMEKARESVPEPGSGRVLNLVHAFEKLLTVPRNSENEDEKEQEEGDIKKGVKWGLPGLQIAEDLILTAESLGLGSQASPSFDSSRGSLRSSTGSFRSQRRTSVSSRRVGGKQLKKKKPKVTSLKPFKLRTEERGKEKEEEFFKKLREITTQEEKQRIPIAQGLPWTTDEPEIPAKPPVKDSTRPLDIKLHTDIRAVDRSEFDHQVAEKMSLIEQYRMERERQLKLAEEEEVKRLRKELVPKAQPMPYFDRPFLPKRSTKQPTVPRDPKFHFPQHKKMRPCDLSHDWPYRFSETSNT